MSQTQFLIGRSGLDLQDDFYPDDLPSEWRFDYYSTLFRALSLPIDTDEDLEEIFEEIKTSEEEFELVISIEKAQLTDPKQLSALLPSVASYQRFFTLFCQLDKPPTQVVMDLLHGYQLCFQSPKPLKLDLKQVKVMGEYLSFNQHPVLYNSATWDEKQMRTYLQEISSINTKAILICEFAESETLNKIRLVSELLGF